MSIPRRKKTPEESLSSDTFKVAAERIEKKRSSKSEPVAKPTLEASTWPVTHWISFFDIMLNEFDVPCGNWKTTNINCKKKVVEQFVESSKKQLGNSASVVEGTLNLLVTWDSPDFRFLPSKPSEFNLKYISKAWESYMRCVKREPLSRLAVYNVSTEFTQRVKRFIGTESPAVWLSNPEPVEWDDHGEEVKPDIEAELDSILDSGSIRPKSRIAPVIPKEDKVEKVESELDIDYWL